MQQRSFAFAKAISRMGHSTAASLYSRSSFVLALQQARLIYPTFAANAAKSTPEQNPIGKYSCAGLNPIHLLSQIISAYESAGWYALILIAVQRFSAMKRKNSTTEMVVTDNWKDFLFSWSYVIIESQKIGREVILAYQRLNKIKILFNREEVNRLFQANKRVLALMAHIAWFAGWFTFKWFIVVYIRIALREFTLRCAATNRTINYCTILCLMIWHLITVMNLRRSY